MQPVCGSTVTRRYEFCIVHPLTCRSVAYGRFPDVTCRTVYPNDGTSFACTNKRYVLVIASLDTISEGNTWLFPSSTEIPPGVGCGICTSTVKTPPRFHPRGFQTTTGSPSPRVSTFASMACRAFFDASSLAQRTWS